VNNSGNIAKQNSDWKQTLAKEEALDRIGIRLESSPKVT
jgi:hypothetical protein